MNFRLTSLLLAALLPGGAAVAGPCASEIYDVQVAIDQRLNAAAARGPEAAESSQATMHRQPTPKSLAQAEEQLGDLSPEAVRAAGEAMERARAADASGDAAVCAKALQDAKAALKP